MPISDNQKVAIAQTALRLARQIATWNSAMNAFIEEWFAEDYASLITNEVLAAAGTALTQQEFVDGVAAMDAISTTIETNKTNLYRIAK